MRLLVIEDDAKLRTLLCRGLVEEGYAVDSAGTAADAIWRATEYAYDAILLDVGLPDSDGFTVCHHLREHGCWVPVLMLTALDAVDHRVRGLDVGADDYLVKPFAFPELVAGCGPCSAAGPSRAPRRSRSGTLNSIPRAAPWRGAAPASSSPRRSSPCSSTSCGTAARH